MRALVFSLCGLLLALPAMAQEAAANPQVIKFSDLNNGKAIIKGRFGQPLGECFKLRAKVYRDERFKATSSTPVLSITHVNDQKLKSPLNHVEFLELRFAEGKIPSSKIGLIPLKSGKSTEPSYLAVEKLEVDDVTLIAYETGGFYGEARNLPRDIPEPLPYQTNKPTEFYFHLTLYVVKVEEDDAAKPQTAFQK